MARRANTYNSITSRRRFLTVAVVASTFYSDCAQARVVIFA